MLRAWSRFSEHLPSTCQVCGRWPARPVCPACEQRFAAPRHRCTGCATPLDSAAGLCGACQTRTAPAVLQCCVAAVDYAYPWDGLIARFKFRGEPGWAGPMAEWMLRAPQARRLIRQCDLIVPVPLTTSRLASRGYNQAWELVKALRRSPMAKAHRTPALADALVRTGDTPDQHSLPREQRLSNRQGVFVAHPRHACRWTGSHVLLVDDVSTTGATLQSAAQALLQAGARQVSALVFARTPPR